MTPRLKSLLLRIPVFFGISILLESFQFQQIGISSSYPNINELWLIKHFMIALILGAFFRIEKQSELRKRIAKYFGFSFFTTLVIHLDYPGTRFCGLWCGDLQPLVIPFIFLWCLLETGIVLFSFNVVGLEMPKAKKPLYVLLILFPIYFIGRPLYLKHLDKIYPVTWLNDTSSFRGEATYRRVSYGGAENFLSEFEKLASQISKEQWTRHCARYAFFSFNNTLFGKSHADACYYYAAVSYRDPALCSNLSFRFREECETGVTFIKTVDLRKKELRVNSPSGPLLREVPFAPELSIFDFDFHHGPTDHPYLKVFNPTSNDETFPDIEILGGLEPKSILKLGSLNLKPGEVHRIDLSSKKQTLSELGFGADFLMLEIKSKGKTLQSFHNRILLNRYKALCLKSWNLNPTDKKPLYIELYNFSDTPQNAERTDIHAYGFNHFFTKSLSVPARRSQRIELEFLRNDLQAFLLKERPTEILSKSLIVTSFPGGTMAATGNIEKVINFCASPKD